jgi:hypothetical protein
MERGDLGKDKEERDRDRETDGETGSMFREVSYNDRDNNRCGIQ